MKRSGSSDDCGDRGRRLGPNARGSMDFLLLCMKRGVPSEKISSFLLGLGIDVGTVNRWMDQLKREMAGLPERPGPGNYSTTPVARPAGSEPFTLDGKTATDFILPDLDATKTKLGEKSENPVMAEEEPIDVSLEISAKELQKAQESPVERVALDAPVSMLVSAPPESIPSVSDNARIQLEKPRSSKKRRKSKSEGRKILETPQGRLAAFAAAILITWLLSDAGWFPGGSARHSAMPANDVVTHEEPVSIPQDRAPVAGAVAPRAEEKAGDTGAQAYPDPWAPPGAKNDSNRAPSSNKSPYRRPSRPKRQRTSY